MSKTSPIKSLKSLSNITARYNTNTNTINSNTSNYDSKLDKLSTITDKFCFNCQKMNYSLQADSSTNLRLNYRCKSCNKLI